MVKLRFLLMAVLMLAASTQMYAGWRIVVDKNCIKIVSSNLAAQKLIEEQHNARLDTIAAKQQKVELYSVSMATMKELYKLSMQNISGFGTESLYYKEIGSCALDIIRNVPELIKTVSKGEVHQPALLPDGTRRAGDGNTAAGRQLCEYREQCPRYPNPLKGEGTAEKKSDGYNMLDRYERMSLANSIYTNLNEIRYKVDGMMLMAQYATLNDLCFAIDPEGWANVMTMRNQVDGLVSDWNGLVAAN